MTGRNNFLSIKSHHRVPSRGTISFDGGLRADLGAGRSTLHLGNLSIDDDNGHSTAFVGSVTGVQPMIGNFD